MKRKKKKHLTKRKENTRMCFFINIRFRDSIEKAFIRYVVLLRNRLQSIENLKFIFCTFWSLTIFTLKLRQLNECYCTRNVPICWSIDHRLFCICAFSIESIACDKHFLRRWWTTLNVQSKMAIRETEIQSFLNRKLRMFLFDSILRLIKPKLKLKLKRNSINCLLILFVRMFNRFMNIINGLAFGRKTQSSSSGASPFRAVQTINALCCIIFCEQKNKIYSLNNYASMRFNVNHLTSTV